MIRGTIAAGMLVIAATAFAAAPPATTTATATMTTAVDTDSSQTRMELQSLLRGYPPEVGAVLKLDPTLFGNPSYMANYPKLAAFATQHPEVAHNPGFFLDSIIGLPDRGPNQAGYRIWREVLSDLGGFAAFLVVTSVFVWAIKTLIEQRRWSRLTRMQTEVHSKLLDRFTSNEELLAYIQTPGGRRFLESAPISLESGPRPMSAPVGRIFWSLQVGLVAIGAGIGFDLVSLRAQSEVAELLYGIGVIGLLVGIAFVLSAMVFYSLSRKFGLWQPPAAGAAGDAQ